MTKQEILDVVKEYIAEHPEDEDWIMEAVENDEIALIYDGDEVVGFAFPPGANPGTPEPVTPSPAAR